jgi:hypothetical protein
LDEHDGKATNPIIVQGKTHRGEIIMRTKIFAILVAIAMCGLIPLASADTNVAVITVTLTPGGTAYLHLSSTTWLPSVSVGGNVSTAVGAYVLTNSGSVTQTVKINGSSTAAWTLGATPGPNAFNMSYKITGASWVAITTGQLTFDGSMAPADTKDIQLRVFMPTSSSTNTNQYTTITFTGTAS